MTQAPFMTPAPVGTPEPSKRPTVVSGSIQSCVLDLFACFGGGFLVCYEENSVSSSGCLDLSYDLGSILYCGCCNGNPVLPCFSGSNCCPGDQRRHVLAAKMFDSNAQDEQSHGFVAAKPIATESLSPQRRRNRSSRKSRNLQLGFPTVKAGSILSGVLEIDFPGSSGRMEFGKERGKERNSEDVMIGLYNIRPGRTNSQNDNQPYQASLVSVFRDGKGWEDVAGTRTLYRDGSPIKPANIREFHDENFIAPGIRGLGLALMFVAWMVGIGGLIGLYIFRKDGIILRAQPFFLKLLCMGSIVMSTSILTLSWDEGAGWSDQQLDVACTMTPWFFFLGHILTFCALFTKLWRIDKVMTFRRQAVTVNSVLLPTFALLTVTLAVLIVWTVVDAWKWERVVIREIPSASFGQCQSENVWPFLGPLAGILFGAEAATFYFAWKTADVPEDFRDSGAVMYSSFTQLQSWAIGGPMLLLLKNSSSDAIYFARVMLIWIFAASSVLVVIAPKVAKAWKLRRNPELLRPKHRVSITGLTLPTNARLKEVRIGEQYENAESTGLDGSESASFHHPASPMHARRKFLVPGTPSSEHSSDHTSSPCRIENNRWGGTFGNKLSSVSEHSNDNATVLPSLESDASHGNLSTLFVNLDECSDSEGDHSNRSVGEDAAAPSKNSAGSKDFLMNDEEGSRG
jgi:7 transmembrane sweet-taste receptor of 3 GCPR